MQYASADGLVDDLLIRGGVPCNNARPGRSVGSSTLRCDVPMNGGPSGSSTQEIGVTVWPTPAKASAGVAAWINFENTLANIDGKRYWVLSGANWMIDAGNSSVVAQSIEREFGGSVTQVS